MRQQAKTHTCAHHTMSRLFILILNYFTISYQMCEWSPEIASATVETVNGWQRGAKPVKFCIHWNRWINMVFWIPENWENGQLYKRGINCQWSSSRNNAVEIVIIDVMKVCDCAVTNYPGTCSILNKILRKTSTSLVFFSPFSMKGSHTEQNY